MDRRKAACRDRQQWVFMQHSIMNSNFTDRAGSRMSVGFAAFFGLNIRHKFDYSLRTESIVYRIPGSDERTHLRYFRIRCPMRHRQLPVERAARKFRDQALGGVFENWQGVKLCRAKNQLAALLAND